MTDFRMALGELFEKGGDGDLLREMIGFLCIHAVKAAAGVIAAI
jgi:hypothetical protein